MIASVILILYFIGAFPLGTSIISLYLCGILLFIAEAIILSPGLLSLNGLLALYAGFALQTGDTLLGLEMGWPLLFGIGFIEFGLLFITIWIWKKHRKISPATGTDAMIGKKATVIEWSGKHGRISFEGEVWKAESERELDINAGENVTIARIENLTLIISV